MREESAPFLKGLSSEIGSSVELGARITADAIEDAVLRILQDMAAHREGAGEKQRALFLQTEAGLHLLLSVSRLAPALAGRFASASSYVAMSAGLAALREARAAMEEVRQNEPPTHEPAPAQSHEHHGPPSE